MWSVPSRSPEKVGSDLGNLAGLGRPLDFLVSADAEHVLATTRPDIVLLGTQSFLPEIQDQLALCLRNGANVITLSEESLYPWSSSPARAAELDALAKTNRVTVTGSGHQDVFWLNMVSMLMGTAHRIDSVCGRVSWNADEFGADVIRSKHVGETLAEFEAFTNDEIRPPGYGRNVLGGLTMAARLTPLSWDSTISPITTGEDRFSESLRETLPAGSVVGYSDIDTLTTVEGPSFSFEMAGYVYEDGAYDINEWGVLGEPDLHLSNGAVPTQATTCTQWVNRIPDVINAPSGFVTVDQLPALVYRSQPMHSYVRAGLLQ